MPRLLLSFISVLLFCSLCTHARRNDLEFDTSVRLVRPLPCNKFRMLPSVYDSAGMPWYTYGKSSFKSGDWPLSNQIDALLNNNCSNGEIVSVALEDVKMYLWTVSSLYVHAEFFTGQPGTLHHFYTLDTIVQKQSPVLLHGLAEKLASENFLDAMLVVCKHMNEASAEAYSDESAANYYKNLLTRYPLYTQQTTPSIGIYRTVNDFMNLKAVDTSLIFEHIARADGDGYNWFYHKTADGGKGKRIDADDFYAASDGKNLYLSYKGGLRKIRKTNGDYFVSMTTKMLGASPIDAAGLIDRAISRDGQGSRSQMEIVERFSVQRKTFLPYGGKLPHE